MQATDLTPRGLELEVCLHCPSPPEERGGLKRGLHSNCWGEVRRTAAHVHCNFKIYLPLSALDGGGPR